MKKNQVLGIDFEQSRPKMKKDPKFFQKLEYKETDLEPNVIDLKKEVVEIENSEEISILPFGLK